MRVGVGWGKLQRGAVSLNGFRYAPGLVEDIAEIEVCQGIPRINFDRPPVMLFCERVLLPIVVKRA